MSLGSGAVLLKKPVSLLQCVLEESLPVVMWTDFPRRWSRPGRGVEWNPPPRSAPQGQGGSPFYPLWDGERVAVASYWGRQECYSRCRGGLLCVAEGFVTRCRVLVG